VFKLKTTINSKEFNYDKYINYLLIGYAFSFPISKAGTNFFEIFILLLWILEGKWHKKITLYKSNLLSISIILLISVSLLSIFLHGNIEFTLNYIAKYRHLLIILVFYSSLKERYVEIIISAFLLGMLISEIMSYLIFLEFIQYKDILPTDPSPFMSHMTYSTVLAFTISLLLIKVLYQKKLHYKFAYILFFLTASANLFINGGRTGQIIYIILIFITFLNLMKNKLKAIAISTFILLLTGFIAYIVSPNFHERANKLSTDITNIIYKNNYDGSAGTRLSLSIAGIDTFFDYYLFGNGISNKMPNLKYYFQKNGFDVKNARPIGDYHNAFLTISVQLGIIGLIISILLCYAILKLKFKNQEYKTMSLIFAVSFILFSFTHNTLHTMNPMVYFALFAGLFNAISKLEGNK